MARGRIVKTKHGAKFSGGGRSRKRSSKGYGGPGGSSPSIRRSPGT